VGWDFHRASLTCPQIKRRSHIARDPAPAQGTEASRPDKGTHKDAVTASDYGESLCCLRDKVRHGNI
jgi:hypothetical protein